MQVLLKLLWARNANHELAWLYNLLLLRQAQFLVVIIYRICHQHKMWRRQRHWVRYWHRAECSRELYLPTECRTKIMVLPSWRHTKSRIHVSAVILHVNEGIYSKISLIPRGTQKASWCHHSVQEHWAAHHPADVLVTRARPAQNMEV